MSAESSRHVPDGRAEVESALRARRSVQPGGVRESGSGTSTTPPVSEGLSLERIAEIEALRPDDDFGIHTATCAISVEPGDPDCDCGLTQAFAELLSEVKRLQRTVDATRIVTDHWRRACLDGSPDLRWTAHPLCMVLAALNGETAPEEVGVAEDSADARSLRALSDWLPVPEEPAHD